MLGHKQLKRLDDIRYATDNHFGMYPGVYFESSPRNYEKLIKAGYADYYEPHNPVHSLRVIITDKGREQLELQS